MMRVKPIPFTLIVFLFLVSGGVKATAADARDARPNLVFLMSDDQRWDTFGCYGRPEFKTPHIDELAKQGTLFENCFYAVSICMPSRATAMTGQYLSRHRCGFSAPTDFTVSHKEFANAYPMRLKAAGYRTGFVGKFGFAVTKTKVKGSRPKRWDMQANIGEAFDFFYGSPVHFGQRKTASYWPQDEEMARLLKNRTKSERTEMYGDMMLRFLETHSGKQPFCLSVSFQAVKGNRESDVIDHEHWDMFKNVTMSKPGNHVMGGNPKLPAAVRKSWRGVKLHKTTTGNERGYQQFVRERAAMGHSIDLQVGRLVKKLKTMGVLENTVIIYTSDNGRFHGSHGLYDKALLYEESVRAPLIIFDGRQPEKQRGRRLKQLVSTVDYAPTLLGFAGLDAPDSMQGKSLVELISGRTPPKRWRDAVYMENHFVSDGAQPVSAALKGKELKKTRTSSIRCRGVRTERWKYIVFFELDPRVEQLFDLNNDPLEQNNLAGRVEHAEVLAKLRKRCNALFESARAGKVGGE